VQKHAQKPPSKFCSVSRALAPKEGIMQQVAYRIYYDFNAMLNADPLHTKLSEEEVAENIERLPIEFETMLDDENASASISKSAKGEKILFISTTDDQSTIDGRLVNALKGLSIFGQKLESTSPINA
jgi:hypothetical protein